MHPVAAAIRESSRLIGPGLPLRPEPAWDSGPSETDRFVRLKALDCRILAKSLRPEYRVHPDRPFGIPAHVTEGFHSPMLTPAGAIPEVVR